MIPVAIEVLHLLRNSRGGDPERRKGSGRRGDRDHVILQYRNRGSVRQHPRMGAGGAVILGVGDTQVGAGTTIQKVERLAVARHEPVRSATTAQAVTTDAGNQDVAALVAVERVAAATPTDDVGSAHAVHGIGPASGADHVPARRAHQDVGSLRAPNRAGGAGYDGGCRDAGARRRYQPNQQADRDHDPCPEPRTHAPCPNTLGQTDAPPDGPLHGDDLILRRLPQAPR